MIICCGVRRAAHSLYPPPLNYHSDIDMNRRIVPQHLVERLASLTLLAVGVSVFLFSVAASPGLFLDMPQPPDSLVESYFRSDLPGYGQADILHTDVNIEHGTQRVLFRILTAVSTGTLPCQGSLFFYPKSRRIEVAWDDAICMEAATIVRLARQVLNGVSLTRLYTLYGQARGDATRDLLRRWLAADLIHLDQHLPRRPHSHCRRITQASTSNRNGSGQNHRSRRPRAQSKEHQRRNSPR